LATKPTYDEKLFVLTLLKLAQLSNHQLAKSDIAQIDALAQVCGYEFAIAGLVEFIESVRPGSRFPSVKDFSNVFHPKTSDETTAEEVAFLICATIVKRGDRWHDHFPDDPAGYAAAIETELGELGALVVKRMGGWYQVCQEGKNASEMKTLRAQIKRFAFALMEKARHGTLDEKPQLPGKIAPNAQLRSGSKTLDRADPLKLVTDLKKPEEPKS
jgi:hypothetical protein